MTSRIPEPPSAMEAEGIPDDGDNTASQEASGQDAYGLEPPDDMASALDDYGTTAAEMHDGEPLDVRLAREEPEVLASAGTDADESEGADNPFNERAGQGVGRLVEPVVGAHGAGDAEMTAEDVGTDLGGYSAEESAMHMQPEV